MLHIVCECIRFDKDKSSENKIRFMDKQSNTHIALKTHEKMAMLAFKLK